MLQAFCSLCKGEWRPWLDNDVWGCKKRCGWGGGTTLSGAQPATRACSRRNPCRRLPASLSSEQGQGGHKRGTWVGAKGKAPRPALPISCTPRSILQLKARLCLQPQLAPCHAGLGDANAARALRAILRRLFPGLPSVTRCPGATGQKVIVPHFISNYDRKSKSSRAPARAPSQPRRPSPQFHSRTLGFLMPRDQITHHSG